MPTIVWVENTLVKSGEFKLPGNKSLLKEKENNIEIVLVDVTESPIERSQKNKKMVFGQKERAYNKNSNIGRFCNKRNNLHS